MNNDFPRILALLRKERRLSQKQAAGDLGVAQALLSHYEKGKRECGLSFLVRVADYYGVSTDFLLGRSASSDGSFISESDILDSNELGLDKAGRTKSISLTLAKKMIIGGIDVIYSLLGKFNNPKLTKEVSEFFTLTVYSCFRLVHRANPKNDNNIFGLKEDMGFRAAAAGRSLCEGRAVIAANDGIKNKTNAAPLPLITTATLEDEYNKQAVALMSLVKNSERMFIAKD
ncbi:MAG: helix-turn-helix domain-containing protein [Oscillospiraceae bacterium]|nr:helix-turn-helix domain-containing protein [Oscillospiraceae bacterium]